MALKHLIDATALMTPNEAADALHTTRGHVYLLLKRAELPSVRVGKLIRIPSAAVRRLVAGEVVEVGRGRRADW